MTRKILDMLRYQPWGLRPFDPIWILILCAMPIAQAAGQRITFSVDTHGPTAGASGTDNSIVDAFYGLPITGADILTVGVPQQELPPLPIWQYVAPSSNHQVLSYLPTIQPLTPGPWGSN